jgi:hypothetical protein
MSDVLASLTETKLRKLVGDEVVERAVRHLLTGKVQERMHWSDGDIEAYWDTRLDDIAMHATSQARSIALDCTCGEMDGDMICDHVVAMLLAWVTDPGTFVNAEDEEEDEYSTLIGASFLDSGRTGRVAKRKEPIQQEYLRLLSGLTLHDLREISHFQGIRISGNRKEPILHRLAEVLSDPGKILEAWRSLSPAARRVAGILPFVLVSEDVASRTMVWKTVQKWGLRSEDDFRQAFVELKLAGLAFLSSSGTIGVPSWLPFLLPADPEFTPGYPSTGGEGGHLKPEPLPSPLDFTQIITHLVLMLEAGGDRFIARPKAELHPILRKYSYLQGWPYAVQELDALQAEKNLAQALWTRSFRISYAPPPLAEEPRRDLASSLHIDVVMLDFMFHLLEAFGILVMKEGQPVRINKEKTAEWFQLTSFNRAMFLLTNYANMDNWTEFDLIFHNHAGFVLRRSPQYSSMVSYNQMLALLARSRRNLMYQVRRQPPGRWTDFGALIERARLLPNVTNAFTTNSPWFFEMGRRKLDPGRPEDWNLFYGLFAEAVLNGPLRWQGLVEVAYRDKRMAAFRLTDFGAALLMQDNEYQLPPPEMSIPALKYATHGGLLLHSETAGSELLQLLSALGEAHLTADGEIGYRVSASGAARAFSAGWNLDQMLKVLQGAAGASLPSTLAASLRKWWQEFGSLHIYDDVALIELADDHILNELLAGTSLSRYLLYRFSPRLVALRPEGVDLLREELVKKGYTPKISKP